MSELQRFALAMMSVQDAVCYMIDEPSSYLDIKQRLRAGDIIRRLARTGVYVIAIEHDLIVLEYFSDLACYVYGRPGHVGAFGLPAGSFNAIINTFLRGSVVYGDSEYMRFRDAPLSFHEVPRRGGEASVVEYPAMTKSFGAFSLEVSAGNFCSGEVIVLLGQNGRASRLSSRCLQGPSNLTMST